MRTDVRAAFSASASFCTSGEGDDDNQGVWKAAQDLQSGDEVRRPDGSWARVESVGQREDNPAFVLMQYFWYLRRNIDQAGYDFWLDVVTNREPGKYRGMVCAFITSAE